PFDLRERLTGGDIALIASAVPRVRQGLPRAPPRRVDGRRVAAARAWDTAPLSPRLPALAVALPLCRGRPPRARPGGDRRADDRAAVHAVHHRSRAAPDRVGAGVATLPPQPRGRGVRRR